MPNREIIIGGGIPATTDSDTYGETATPTEYASAQESFASSPAPSSASAASDVASGIGEAAVNRMGGQALAVADTMTFGLGPAIGVGVSDTFRNKVNAIRESRIGSAAYNEGILGMIAAQAALPGMAATTSGARLAAQGLTAGESLASTTARGMQGLTRGQAAILRAMAPELAAQSLTESAIANGGQAMFRQFGKNIEDAALANAPLTWQSATADMGIAGAVGLGATLLAPVAGYAAGKASKAVGGALEGAGARMSVQKEVPAFRAGAKALGLGDELAAKDVARLSRDIEVQSSNARASIARMASKNGLTPVSAEAIGASLSENSANWRNVGNMDALTSKEVQKLESMIGAQVSRAKKHVIDSSAEKWERWAATKLEPEIAKLKTDDGKLFGRKMLQSIDENVGRSVSTASGERAGQEWNAASERIRIASAVRAEATKAAAAEEATAKAIAVGRKEEWTAALGAATVATVTGHPLAGASILGYRAARNAGRALLGGGEGTVMQGVGVVSQVVGRALKNEEAMKAGVRNLVFGVGRKPKATFKSSIRSRKDYEAALGRATEYVSPQYAQRVMDAAEAVRPYSDKLANQMIVGHGQAAQKLAARIPPPAKDLGSMRKQPKPVDVSLSEHAFGRYLEGLENPAGVIQRLSNGTVSKEHIDALRDGSPELYEEMTSYLRQSIAEARAKGREYNLDEVASMCLMTGEALDPLFEPGTVSSIQQGLQAMNQQMEEQAQQNAPPENKGSAKGSTYATVTEEIGV